MGGNGRGAASGRSPLALAAALLGLAFLGLAYVPGAAAWADANFGATRILGAGLGFLFLYAAWLGRAQARTRRRLLELLDEVLKAFYGPDFRREREAIDVLVSALRSDKPDVRASAQKHLERLTGQRFGEDAEAWGAWWSDRRSTWASRAARDARER